MNTSNLSKWAASQLRATILATIAGENALRIAIRKKVYNEEIPDERIALMNQEVEATIMLSEKMLQGKNLDVILVVDNTKTKKEEKIKAKYDNMGESKSKLQAVGRELKAWFPINFASYDEWNEYMDGVRQEFKAAKPVMA